MLSQFSKNKNSISAYWICWRPRNHRNLTKKSVGACHPAISLDRHLLKLHLGLEGWHWLSQWTAPSPEETRGQLAGPWWINWHKWPKWQNQQMCSWAKKPAVKELIQSTILFGFFTDKNTSPRLLTMRIKVKASWVLGLMMNLAACIGIERPSRHKLQASIPLATTQINLVQVNWVNSQWHMTSRPQHMTKHWKNTIQVQPSGCNTTQINQLSQFTINTSRPQHVTGLFDSFLNRTTKVKYQSMSVTLMMKMVSNQSYCIRGLQLSKQLTT